MAKIDKLPAPVGIAPMEILNLSAAVGSSAAVNHPDDVMVVQALLIYLNPHQRGFGINEGPEWPTGTFDKATAWAIKKYQVHANRLRKNGLRLIEDGRISPAQGKFAFGRSAYIWTIAALNFDALETALLSGHNQGHIEYLCRRFPEIKAMLKVA
ncbi:MAG: peptidoglycan-binding domain-containing protein [Acidobacteriota bacterium]